MKISSPGPKYVLPKTIGMDRLDPTFQFNPAFSFGTKFDDLKKTKNQIPGPKYNINKVTRFGQYQPIASSLGPKLHIDKKPMPGPNRYAPEKYSDPFHINPPAYSLRGKLTENQIKRICPGPNKYNLPETIGTNLVDKLANPAYSILGRNFLRTTKNVPAPNRYDTVQIHVYKKKNPNWIISGLDKVSDKTVSPAPKYYPNNISRQAPQWSFGIKHSSYTMLIRTSLDSNEFYGF